MGLFEQLDGSHLQNGRQEQFRVAREQVLQAIGTQTITLSHHYPDVPVGAITVEEPSYISPADSGFMRATGTISHRLKIGCNTIGRFANNDIILQDTQRFISRRHCSIVVHTDGSAEVFDTSLNGTFVNGRRVKRLRVKSGDRIRLGPKFVITLILYNND
jgi:hypothetical protein